MGSIPLHLQRRFERRWAARFVAPAASAVPKSIGLKGTAKGSARNVKRVDAGDRRNHSPAPTKPA
jgi:hypothetical protein